MTTASTNSANPTNPDAALLVGGPADINQIPKDGEVHPDLKKKDDQKTKYELNGKSFDSIEEMSKYVADLEKKVVEPRQEFKPPPQVDNTKVVIDGLTLDQLMFANPERYNKYVLDQAEAKLDLKLKQQEDRRVFWSDFYTNNPDLKGKEEVVDAIVFKNWQTWQTLAPREFAKVVSDSSRSTLKKVGAFNSTEVKSGDAATLSASGNTVPNVTQTRRETNFVEEMKLRESARRKAKVK